MHEHHAEIQWRRETEDFGYEHYNRAHRWRFDAGLEVPASAAPAFLGNEDRVDPEEAFVASLASCHMLTFLALASRKRLVVDEYQDAAVGILEKDADGRQAITRVTLTPRIRFGPDTEVSEATLASLHERAHKECFIANSVRTVITVASG